MKREAWVVGLAWLVASPVVAQRAEAGGTFQRYTFSEPSKAGLSEVQLFTLPFSASEALGRWLSLDLRGGFARGSVVGPGGGSASMAGLIETEIGLGVPLRDGTVVLRLDTRLPASQPTQSLEQATVAGIVASDLLPFAIDHWGGAGSVGASAAVSFEEGHTAVGLVGSYIFHGKYDLLRGEPFGYRPGNELRLRALADAPLGKTSLLSVLLGFQRFGSDSGEGEAVFRAGTQVEGAVSVAMPVGLIGSAVMYGGFRHRGGATGLVSIDWLPGVSASRTRQLINAGLDLRLRLGPMTLLPDSEFRLLRSADGICYRSRTSPYSHDEVCPAGQGWVLSGGVGVELELTGNRGLRLLAVPAARLRVGEVLDWRDAESLNDGLIRQTGKERTGLSGWEIGVTVRLARGT